MNGWFWVRIGAALGFLGVAFGAFGAHGLKERLADGRVREGGDEGVVLALP